MKSELKNKICQIFGRQRGFTLIETLVAVSIFVLIVLVLTLFSRNIWIYNSFVYTELGSVNAGRTALKTMAAEIRTASSGSNGGYAINLASATSFTFYSDIYDDGLKERVRYFLNGTNLQKGVIKPTGSPLGYTGSEVVTTLVPNVTNSTIFEYYDEDYDGTTPALSSTADVSPIRLVKITITTDTDPNRAPAPITFTTQVSLRNIKGNL
ncbi:MAG: type II secretion system protein [Candidatus Nomurabacteria bacterium]|nr:type II secretion system protein [Candidatus Nomurabacteria bacterium]